MKQNEYETVDEAYNEVVKLRTEKDKLANLAREMVCLVTKETRGDIDLYPYEMAKLEELSYIVLNFAAYGIDIPEEFKSE